MLSANYLPEIQPSHAIFKLKVTKTSELKWQSLRLVVIIGSNLVTPKSELKIPSS